MLKTNLQINVFQNTFGILTETMAVSAPLLLWRADRS